MHDASPPRPPRSASDRGRTPLRDRSARGGTGTTASGRWTLGSLVLGAALASGLGSPAAPVAAQDSWSTPFPGVRVLRRTAAGPRRIFAAEIDLCAAGISVRATEPDESRRTVPSFGSATGVELTVNGDFYNTTTYVPSGRAVGADREWGNADTRSRAFVGFGADRLLLSPRAEVLEPLPGWVTNGVGAFPEILVRGEIVDLSGSDLCTARHPRTFLGTSEDRRTLYLAVVDGRSSASIGMTCAEGAALMRGLGAHDAMNLDGGGSSTFWVRGDGVLNDPSDGTPRVVSNHLGIHATGSGAPGSCMPYEPYEVSALAPVVERGPSTDLDGDGRADLCVRASAGIRCYRSTGAAFGAPIVGPELSDASGWGDPTNHETLLLGDVTGDGLADVCARANAGVRCWPSTGVGFDASFVGPELSDAAGWARPSHYATMRMADVDGDGALDLCARAAAGLECWRSTGTSFEPFGPTLSALSDAAGFASVSRWGTIRMGDVDGDGRDDVCARGAAGVDCWRSTGAGFASAPLAGPRWADAEWSAHATFSTIRLADVDGDGRADLCGRSTSGFVCHLATDGGFGAASPAIGWTDASGWADLANHSTIRLADIDGDGDLDACARSDSGVACHLWNGTRFEAHVDGPALSDASGWSRARYFRTLRFADLDGDGDEDLCARAARGIVCWRAESGAFGASFDGPVLSDETGWWADRFHGSLRLAGGARPVTPPAPPAPPPDAGASDPHAPDAGAWTPPTLDDGGAMPDGTRDAGASAPTRSGPRGAVTGGCSARGARGGSSAAAILALGLLGLARPSRRRAQPGGALSSGVAGSGGSRRSSPRG